MMPFFLRKFHPNLVKIYGVIIVALTIPTEASADNIAILGGIDLTGSGPAYAALVSSSDELIVLALSGDAATGGVINSVSMDSSGNSLLGGQGQAGGAYAALVSPSGEITPLIFSAGLTSHGVIYSAALNSSGNGIIGGRDTTGPIYAALVSSLGNPLLPLTFPEPTASGGVINSVAINDSGNSLIGGQAYFDAQPAYIASVSTSGEMTSLTLAGGIATSGTINSVAINSSGNGIAGGQDLTGSHPAYAALVSSSGTLTPLVLGDNMATSGRISSVAITSSGNGIVGGQDLTGSQPAYAALVSSGTVTPLALGDNMATSGTINSVAINSSGNGIIGGQDLTGSQPAYAALFTSSGTVIPLTFAGGIAASGWINSVALPKLLAHISTTSLSGNNLIFANYINEFAPEKAFYFVPATLDGTLNEALQSAAPTRNAVSIYTAGNNLFNLTTSFANHIRNQQSERFLQLKKTKVAIKNTPPSEELLTSLSLQKKPMKSSLFNSPYSIWLEAIGALAYQKKQDQTAGFNPTTGGAILACDRMITQQLRIGGGMAYLFTHIQEKECQGHSNINQEEAYIYSSWDNQQFYIDTLVMCGAVQIDHIRNNKMTGFAFRSSSHPKGWQLLPHLELGFKSNLANQSKTSKFSFNPLFMLDWANAWQGSYKEQGDSPFNAGQKSYYGSLLRTEVGLRFYETLFFECWNLSIQEKISYVNTQSFNAGKVNAFLVGSPGSFTVETLSSAQNLALAQLAMSFDPGNARYPTSTLFYQGEFGSQYQSHQLNIELAWQF